MSAKPWRLRFWLEFRRFLINTIISVLLFTVATEFILNYLATVIGPELNTANPLLSAVYAFRHFLHNFAASGQRP